jgi:hypothetical protein
VIRVEAPQRELASVARALDDEADGRQMRVELSRNLYTAIQPIVSVVRGALLGMATAGLPHEGESLRRAVAREIEPHIRISETGPGAFIRVRKITVRGFYNAPKRLNARRGWHHPVYGRGSVLQVGERGWFDDNTQRGAERYRIAVARAVQTAADRIARSA